MLCTSGRATKQERYGSENSTIAGTLQRSRGVIRECESALAALAFMERKRSQEEEEKRVQEEEERRAQEEEERGKEEEERGKEEDEEVCQCPMAQGGATKEDAVELSDSDSELEILAVTYRQIQAQQQPPPPPTPPVDQAREEVIGGAFLTAEDISGHQMNQKIGHYGEEEEEALPMDDKESCTSVDGAVVIGSALKEVKAALKTSKAKKSAKVLGEGGGKSAKVLGEGRGKSAKVLGEGGGKSVKVLGEGRGKSAKVLGEGGGKSAKVLGEGRGKSAKVLGKGGGKSAKVLGEGGGKRARAGKESREEDEGDDLEEHSFGSPRRKKTRDVKYAESDKDEPDYEVGDVESNSDREPSPEVEDPFDYAWREVAVIERQSKRNDHDPEGQDVCDHVFEIRNDVGRACNLCGLIREDIKDMLFKWHAPKTVRQQSQARAGRADMWDEDGDGVLEEEARLVGMPPLEAHNSLEDAMHPHQLEGFKFLSKNLVEEDSGGCMLAFAPGTGKSFLIISFIHSFMLQVPNARPMIVAPKSMLRPWTQEFKKWQVEETLVLNLYEAGDDAGKVEMLKLWQETRSVLLVGYAQCTNMCGEIGRYLIEGPGLMVLDEGHLARTEQTKILKSLSRVHTKRRVLLSGTPFNNNFQEFYTTLELVRPDFMRKASGSMEATLNALMPTEPKASETVNPFLRLPSQAGRQAFRDAIGENLFDSGKHESVSRALGQLRRLIEPFVAWHKGQILETLPGITDLTIMLELSAQQRELLENNKSEVRDSLQKRAAAIYVHPLLEPVLEGGKRSEKDPRLRGENIELKQGVKLRWVMDLIQLCEAAGEKVLIFSEYLYTLALIENVAMDMMKWSKGSQILRIDGKMEPRDREAVINRFNGDTEAKMLCASIKACGEGISLVGASRVVILEVVWNPSVTRQAISRAFRIGQQRKVVVYRLIAADTHEEHKVHATATRKEWLSKLLFDPSISCVDPNSILWDVTDDCSDRFFYRGALRGGVKRILEREF